MDETTENKELMKGLEDDKQTSLEDKMNPLEIPVVVQIIGSYINKVKDVKSVRMLATCWRDETFKKWRNSAVLLINNETLPLLLQAYSEQNWEDLNQEEKIKIDPFQLRQVPFKGYRFSKEQSWAYPLKDNELDKKLIWDKVIKPNATYLDVGESAMKWYRGSREGRKNYNYGLYWIVTYSENVKELAMAPIKSDQGLFEELEDDDEVINTASASRDFNWLSETKAVRLETLTISEPEIVENENQDCFLFSDEDHRVDDLAYNFFCRTPNLKNFRLQLTDKHQASDVMEGLRHSIYKNRQIRLVSLHTLGIESELLLGYYLGEIDEENTLKELKMSLPFSECATLQLFDTMHYPKEKLTRLELDIDCKKKFNEKPPIQDLQLFKADFPNLVRFKVNLDYKTFPGTLLKFNLNDLKGMPSLEEFHFGTKGNLVDKDWITRKLNFDENATPYPDRRGVMKLPCLKTFHFHGNFTKEAMQKFGRVMENLRTLEVVLDNENFSAVKETWPKLRNLKLLPCSDVPEEDVKDLEDYNPSWNVINESARYSQCALNEVTNNDSD